MTTNFISRALPAFFISGTKHNEENPKNIVTESFCPNTLSVLLFLVSLFFKVKHKRGCEKMPAVALCPDHSYEHLSVRLIHACTNVFMAATHIMLISNTNNVLYAQ